MYYCLSDIKVCEFDYYLLAHSQLSSGTNLIIEKYGYYHGNYDAALGYRNCSSSANGYQTSTETEKC